jgi:hypothetical protein
MSRPTELQAEAHRLAKDGQYLASHLLLLQAAGEAQKLGDLEKRLSCNIEALIMGGKADISAAMELNLLIDIRIQMLERPDTIPVNTNFNPRGYVEYKYFDHLADHNPARAELEAALHTMSGVHPADYLHLRRQFYRLIGDDEAALDAAEKAWAAYDEALGSTSSVGSIFHRPSFLLNGFYIQLDRKELASAKQWLEGALREVLRDPCVNCEFNCLNAQLSLALAEGQGIAELRSLSRQIEAHAMQLERIPSTDFQAIRVALLDQEHGDPYAPGHPSYRALSTRRAGDSVELASRYYRALLILDFRIAALRYAAGLEAVDDQYYSKPQTPRERTSVGVLYPDVGVRIRKCHAACKVAMKYACQLDSLLECSWRQRLVNERARRIAEILEWRVE